MHTPGSLTTKQLEEILLNVYKKGQMTKELQAVDMINEMKETILNMYASKQDKES